MVDINYILETIPSNPWQIGRKFDESFPEISQHNLSLDLGIDKSDRTWYRP